MHTLASANSFCKLGYTSNMNFPRFLPVFFIGILGFLTADIENPAQAGDLQFSLRINSFQSGHDPAQEAASALWNDPMNQLIRATNAELGRLLVGQPGGVSAPVIAVGFQAGIQPRVIARVIDSAIVFSDQTVIRLPWDEPETDAEFERRFIEEFSRRLQSHVGSSTTVP